MNQTKLTVNLDGLEEIKKKVGASMRARVGVLGAHGVRKNGDGITNAELLLIHMFGSVSRNIPPRDPLLMPIERNRRELIRQLGSGPMRAAFMRGDYKLMFEILGNAAENFVHEAFDTGGYGMWPPDAPATISAKGSSAILIDTRQLERSITHDVVKQSGEQTGGVQQLAGG